MSIFHPSGIFLKIRIFATMCTFIFFAVALSMLILLSLKFYRWSYDELYLSEDTLKHMCTNIKGETGEAVETFREYFFHIGHRDILSLSGRNSPQYEFLCECSNLPYQKKVFHIGHRDMVSPQYEFLLECSDLLSQIFFSHWLQ